MLELVLAGIIITALIGFASRLRLERPPVESSAPECDLPCPWCLASTAETDSSCRSCGRAFGHGPTSTTKH